MLEEELRRRVPMSPRPVQQGRMRVLTGANMPAALVEMAYLTNREQAGKAKSDDFQERAWPTRCTTRLSRFRTYADEKLAP